MKCPICPKCGSEEISELSEKRTLLYLVCESCNTYFTGWQQAEIDRLLAALKEETDTKYRLVKEIADFKTEIHAIYHKLADLLYPTEEE
jgi:GTPase SAR1 family protein